MIANEKLWQQYVDINKDDPYGKCCVEVARQVMKMLDEDDTPLRSGYDDPHTPHGIICKADDDISAGGITGFMASCVSGMISQCHSRGEEWAKAEKESKI